MKTEFAVALFIVGVPALSIALGCIAGHLSAWIKVRRINKLIRLNACRCNPKPGTPDPQLLYVEFRRRGKTSTVKTTTP